MGILLGISGVANTGKDTSADYLVDNYDFVKISFSDILKRFAQEAFDFSDEQLWGPSQNRNVFDYRYNRYPELNDDSWTKLSPLETKELGPRFLTPRMFLQKIGTEGGRSCYKNVWIEYGLRSAKKILNNPSKYDYTYKKGCFESDRRKNPVQGVVFADARFLNEVNFIKKSGGPVIRLLRPNSGLSGSYASHQSEKEQEIMSDDMFNFIIKNNGTIKDLYNKLDNIMDELNYLDVMCGDQQVS